MQHNPETCSYYAVINLFRVRGLKSPTFDELADLHLEGVAADEYRKPATRGEPLTPFDYFSLLAWVPFPSLCALMYAPHGIDRRLIIEPLAEAGCHFILSYSWRHPATGAILGHTTVLERCGESGYVVLDSHGGYEDYSTVELEPSALSLEQTEAMRERLRRSPHGVRNIIPYDTGVCTPEHPVGFNDYFIVAYPNISEGA
jgi:hypothetical protein